MRREPDYFGDHPLALIYIAKRLTEALRLEKVLSDGGVEYAVEPDTYKGGVIFSSQRIGAFFYVLPDAVDSAREVMVRSGFRMNQEQD